MFQTLKRRRLKTGTVKRIRPLVNQFRPSKGDPTGTSHLQNRWVRRLNAGLTRIARAITREIVTEDGFGFRQSFLKNPAPLQTNRLALELNRAFGYEVVKVAEPELQLNQRFAFATDDAKLTAFNAWFQEQVDVGLLTPVNGEGLATTEFVESSYKKGVADGYSKTQAVTAGGAYDGTKAQFLRESFSSTTAVSQIRMLSTRSFEGLKGITANMGAQINRGLADGFAKGLGPREIARNLRDTVGLSRTRAETLARTEIVHAYSEGTLDSFERLGVEDVGIEAEWLTAGDDRVCPDCAEREGQIYKVEEARGEIPLHPR